MTVVVVTPPEPILLLPSAKEHLRVEGTDQDAAITEMIQASQAEIEPLRFWGNVAFGRQTLEMTLDQTALATDCCSGQPGTIELPYPPAIEVTSIKYLDANNVEQDWSSGWRLLGAGGVRPARIALAYGASWPSVLADPEAIRIRWIAGYDIADPQLLPARHALKLMVGHLWENREATPDDAIRGAARSLLDIYTRY